MCRKNLLFVYLCLTFVSINKKDYEKMLLEDTRIMVVLHEPAY